MNSASVPNYLRVGADEDGALLTLFFPNVMLWETKELLADDGRTKEVEVVLTFQTGLQRTLVGAQAKKFAEIVGDRDPETTRVVIPDALRGLPIKN